MSEDTAIIVENLSKVYKLYNSPVDRLKESLHPLRRIYHHDFYALNNVNFEIRKGESVGIIGKNGSGKSTLLKILTGVLTPTSGVATVNGKVSALLELGAGFNPDLSGIDNVYFNGMLMGYTREEMEERLDDILSFADIGEFVYQPVKTYSSGMFVRLAFAVAINVDPDILIVDEALAVGDIRFQRKCFSKIEQFRHSGKNILFVSHGLDSVNMLCETAYLLNDGEIVERGAAKSVTRKFQMMMYGEDLIDSQNQDTIQNPLELADTNNENNNSDCQAGNFTPNDSLTSLIQDKISSWNGTKKAEIIDCGIMNKSGHRVTVLESGHSYRFFSRILTYVDLDVLSAGFPVTNAKNLMLSAANSDTQGTDIHDVRKHSLVEGRADVTMWLAPGEYLLTFRTASNGEVHDVLYDQISFVVTGDCKLNSASIVNLQTVVSMKALSVSS